MKDKRLRRSFEDLEATVCELVGHMIVLERRVTEHAAVHDEAERMADADEHARAVLTPQGAQVVTHIWRAAPDCSQQQPAIITPELVSLMDEFNIEIIWDADGWYNLIRGETDGEYYRTPSKALRVAIERASKQRVQRAAELAQAARDKREPIE